MKVRCISKKDIDIPERYSAITIGKEYVVLSIEFYDPSLPTIKKALGDFIAYRLKDNDGVVMLYPSKLFTISSGKLPSCWISYQINNSLYSLLPNVWAREYFWDDYYNDDPIALEDFKKVEKEIRSQE